MKRNFVSGAINFIQQGIERWWIDRLRNKLSQKKSSSIEYPRRLYIDVSVISHHDAGSGIQRVVRAVALHLLSSSYAGWSVHPVSASRKHPYHLVSWPDDGVSTPSSQIEVRHGDVFLGLDFSLDTVWLHRRQLVAFKKKGCELWFVMYDLLPVNNPDWFSDKLVVRYQRWLKTLAALADGFFCISPQTEKELREELSNCYGVNGGYRTCILPMGWDLLESKPSIGITENLDHILKKIRSHPSILMVGTLEPRKGHAEILQAVDLLWQEGHNFNIVIVGRPGWKTEELQSTLRNHPRCGETLFWLDNASDESLVKLYQSCTGVIIASYAEGFGLPLIEALGFGKPVLARDIPVFRLHKDKGLHYFHAYSEPQQLASTIREWLFSIQNEDSIGVRIDLPKWADTAQSIISVLSAEDVA